MRYFKTQYIDFLIAFKRVCLEIRYFYEEQTSLQ